MIKCQKVSEAAIRGALSKDVFLKVSENSQENTCARQSLFLHKVVGHRPETSFKKRLWYKCFPANLAKFQRTPFLQNTSG